MERQRDARGRFISATAQALIEQSNQLSAKADELIAKENEVPSWLKSLIIAIATEIGITPDELEERCRIMHPTSTDPVLLVDNRPIVSWV